MHCRRKVDSSQHHPRMRDWLRPCRLASSAPCSTRLAEAVPVLESLAELAQTYSEGLLELIFCPGVGSASTCSGFGTERFVQQLYAEAP